MSNKIEYFVNEEKGTVVAKISNFQTELWNAVWKVFPYLTAEEWGSNPLAAKYAAKLIESYPDAYIGLAKKYEEDDWNLEKIGKPIARARLLAKTNRAKAKVIYSVNKFITENDCFNAQCLARYYSNKVDFYTNQLEDIVGKVEG